MSDSSPATHDPVNRYALYYPYINIHDANWLKGTVLAFQKVRRIVPNPNTLKDQAITREYEESWARRESFLSLWM
jgi:hypothetical protein